MPPELAETFKLDELQKDPKLKEWLKDAHAKGMTQSQIDFNLGVFLKRATELTPALAQIKADDCTAELKKEWKTEADYTANVSKAFRAGKAYAGSDFEGILKDYGNDARVIRMLAKVGAELGEDKGTPNDAGGAGAADVAKSEHAELSAWLMNDKNKNDPAFESKRTKFNALSNRIWGDKPKSNGATTFSTGR